MPKKLKIDHRTMGGRRKEVRPKYDLGTPELIRKRLMALGPRREGWPDPDAAAAESALGVLLWQGQLHDRYDQAKRLHDAGVSFAGWWTLVHPKSHAQGTLGQFQPKGSTEEVDTGEAEAMLRSASEALKAIGPRVLHAVINVAVYQAMENRARDKLRAGLNRLADWLRGPHAEAIRREYEQRRAA